MLELQDGLGLFDHVADQSEALLKVVYMGLPIFTKDFLFVDAVNLVLSEVVKVGLLNKVHVALQRGEDSINDVVLLFDVLNELLLLGG